MLNDRVILITGASRGIGEAIARAVVDGGGRVVLASRKQADLDRVATGLGDRAFACACHTGKADEVDALFAKATDRFGAIHGVVNNAATNPYFGPLIDTPDAALDKTIEINVRGYLYVARAFVRHVRNRRADAARAGEQTPAATNEASASIVNIASIAGLRAAPMQGIYGATKAAVISLTQTLAYELASSNIRVNAIAPGLVETKFAATIVGNPTLREHIVGRTPLARHAQPQEIAGAAVYLLSDAASFTTGSVMVVDGGVTAV